VPDDPDAHEGPMTVFDLSLDELRAYRPPRDEPADFDAFWAETLAESRAKAGPPRFDLVRGPLRTVSVWDVTFSGFGGQPIRGWFLAPVTASSPLPTVVQYVGYGGGRGFPFDWLVWASAGYAHLVMDTRGQGSTWSPGATPDPDLSATGGQVPGFMTRGVLDPHTYYYRRLITDALLAIDAVMAHPMVDRERIVVTGQSQGGGLSLAAAGLSDRVRATMADVPFLCHWRRAVDISDTDPYPEITRYLATHRGAADAVFRTLSYVDGVNFAARATAPALFSVGLMDRITPPSTVFAAVNHYQGRHEVEVWPFNGHDAGDLDQQERRFAFLEREGLAPDP
jgi:cephalosporin-C deacetylase